LSGTSVRKQRTQLPFARAKAVICKKFQNIPVTKMEEAQGKRKCPLQDLRDKPITQDQLAALLDVTPRAINEMRKRKVLPEPSIAYPVAWTDRKAR
jgi:DNA-binding XRE family transcriptional regulator